MNEAPGQPPGLLPDNSIPPRVEFSRGDLVMFVSVLRRDGVRVEMRVPVSLRHARELGRQIEIGSTAYLAACG